ncbi:MAG: hypothetical protein JRJ20_08085 [Deltaproteobacteria bacterium]|nr:hypothetical protein [Deltaproteobacteria bacterium]
MKYRFRSIALPLIFVLIICISTGFSDEKTDQVDALFAQWNKLDSPGCALAIIPWGHMGTKVTKLA